MANEGLSQESRQRWLDLMAAKQAAQAAQAEEEAATVANIRASMEGLSPSMPLTNMPVQADLTETLTPPEGIALPATGTENVLDAILGETFYTKSQDRIPGEEVARRQNLGLDVVTGEPIAEEPEVLGVAPPPRAAAETDEDEDLSGYIPDVSGYDEAAAAYRAQGRAQRKMGDIAARKGELRFGPEQLTRAERIAQIREERQQRMDSYELEFEDDMEDAMLLQTHPGASLKQIKDWKYDLELNERIVSGARDISPEGAADVLRRAAVAKRNLAKSQEIDPGRAFGNAGSKILAALAIGAGSWAATKTGRNPALELYNKAIANDIAAQKEMFQHKRQAPGRMRSEYKFFMDKYNNAEVAELATAASQWEVAAQELTALGLRTSGVMNQQKANALAGEARGKGQALRAAGAKEARKVRDHQHTGIEGIRYTGKGRAPTEQEKKILFDTVQPTIGAKSAGRQYMKAFEQAIGLKGEAAASGALLARENFIASLGALFEKGVLQEFERKELEKILPGKSQLGEKFWRSVSTQDRVDAVVSRLNEMVDDKVSEAVNTLEFYEFNKPKYAVRKKGERGSSAADMALVKSRGK